MDIENIDAHRVVFDQNGNVSIEPEKPENWCIVFIADKDKLLIWGVTENKMTSDDARDECLKEVKKNLKLLRNGKGIKVWDAKEKVLPDHQTKIIKAIFKMDQKNIERKYETLVKRKDNFLIEITPAPVEAAKTANKSTKLNIKAKLQKKFGKTKREN